MYDSIVYMLDTFFPDYKTSCYLPPDILKLCISYLTKENTKFYRFSTVVRSSGYLIDDKKYGLWKTWYYTGNLCQECYYINNKLHGKYESYAILPPYGIEIKTTYVNGKIHGIFEKMFPLGSKIIALFFNDRIYKSTVFNKKEIIKTNHYKY